MTVIAAPAASGSAISDQRVQPSRRIFADIIMIWSTRPLNRKQCHGRQELEAAPGAWPGRHRSATMAGCSPSWWGVWAALRIAAPRVVRAAQRGINHWRWIWY